MDSKIGLIIQFTGIFLITVMSLFLRRSLKTVASGYWAVGWSSLSVALFSLSLAFNFEHFVKPLFAVYFFAEYFFGLMLVFGCRRLAEDFELTRRHKLSVLPFALIALCLSFWAEDFNVVFDFHAFLLGSFFAAAFFTLGNSIIKSFGWRVMRVALALLALDFFHYFAVFTLLEFEIDYPLLDGYLAFNPIIDLVLEILLGFGMVIVLLEQVLQKVQTVNGKLEEAHQKLEQIAHIDQLTMTLNRHAFDGFLKNSGLEQNVVSGCVGFFDIDELKPINDKFGHAAGDAAIRAVVAAIRNLMRTADLIYRWGGDEFFVIMVSMNAEAARARMSNLERMLTNITVEGVEKPLTVRVSFGFQDFADICDLEQAVKSADEEMYRHKKERKRQRKSVSNPVVLWSENVSLS